MINPFVKGPADVNDWGVDWTAELEEGETIVTSVWVIQTSGTTLTVVNSYIADGFTVVWLSGGSPGDQITVNNFITTSSTPVTRQLSRQLLFWIDGPVAA